jgi:alpha-L-fucosidase
MPGNSIEKAADITPSQNQYNWQTTEFYAFVHFGVNTYTDREWGDGTESPSIFNPVKLDAESWVNAVKSAGMRGLILTCKHHDGFCLWPSKYTEHSVKNSPYKDGKGDIVREVAEACKKGGIKFGVYLSPWDRHEAKYGSGAAYDEYYKNQLAELLTGYGEIFEIWFDGACGEGPNGKKQEYEWESYLKLCKKLQPNAVTFNFGDIRWCGNEAGQTRSAEWSVLPAYLSSLDVILSNVQKEDDTDGSFRRRVYSVTETDLGSREIIKDVSDFIWYPCETDTSIRPGWFYHENEDGKVRPLDELMDIYYGSVGGNSSLLLNIPPDKNGLFHKNDVKRLAEIGDRLKREFSQNFAPADNKSLDIAFERPVEVSKIVIMEDIKKGQRVEAFEIYACKELVYTGQTVGYKKIAVLKNPVKTGDISIKITQSRAAPEIAFVGVY